MQIYGIKYGLRGFYDRNAKPVELNARTVEGIHLRGGTILVRVLVTILFKIQAASLLCSCSCLLLTVETPSQGKECRSKQDFSC